MEMGCSSIRRLSRTMINSSGVGTTGRAEAQKRNPLSLSPSAPRMPGISLWGGGGQITSLPPATSNPGALVKLCGL